MKVFVSIKLRCVIGKFDTMLWGLMRRAFTLFFLLAHSYAMFVCFLDDLYIILLESIFNTFACFSIHDSIHFCLNNCFLIAFLKINFANICWTHMLAAFTAFPKGKVILRHINLTFKFIF